MLKSIVLEKVEYVSLYTGNNGSGACTCRCPCCSQKGKERRYQGTITQVVEMFESLPNLKQLYIFGNPDITVDVAFCHLVALEATKRNIKVCFSTSGVGGKEVLIKLLQDIPVNMVDYISFSFDATTKEEMSFMKGIKYPMEKALQGLEWAIQKGYPVKVQPTLWSCNYSKVEEILEFYADKGVKWFTFHVGSLEANVDLPTHQHLTLEQVKSVHEQISRAVDNHNDVKVRCPIIYGSLGCNDTSKWYCMHPERSKELLIMFTENGINATHAPIASSFMDDLSFELVKAETTDIPAIPESEFCPFSKELTGRIDTCCRYVSKYWNY